LSLNNPESKNEKAIQYLVNVTIYAKKCLIFDFSKAISPIVKFKNYLFLGQKGQEKNNVYGIIRVNIDIFPLSPHHSTKAL